MLISARSSLALKKGLMMANGIGIVDPDYAGPNDANFIIVYNFTKHTVEVKKRRKTGPRNVFTGRAGQVGRNKVRELREDNRGGVGST